MYRAQGVVIGHRDVAEGVDDSIEGQSAIQAERLESSDCSME